MNETSFLIPTVVEKTSTGERAFDIFSRLMRDRVVLLASPVTEESARIIIAQFLFLEAENPGKPIDFYISSPGGVVSEGLAIYDVMQHITSPVHTTCMGTAASMGAFLLAGGHPGQRRILPNSQVMIHQLSGGAQGKGTDVEIAYKNMMSQKDTLTRILAENVGKPYDQVLNDCERDKWLSAQDALEYGLVDEIIQSTRETKRLLVEQKEKENAD